MFASLLSCISPAAHHQQAIQPAAPEALAPDTSRIAILPVTEGVYYAKGTIASIQLSGDELKQVDLLLKQCIGIHNRMQDTTKYLSEYIDLQNYRLQYVPYAADGKRMVLVNGFCRDIDFADWKKRLVQVDDGGACFFHVTLHISDGTYDVVAVNGMG